MNVVLTAIPMVVALVGYFRWAFGTRTSPLPIWNVILLIGGIILFGVCSFFAFHRVRIERDNTEAELSKQPRFAPLSNRDELLRVITEARIATIKFIEAVDDLKNWEKSWPNLVNVEAMTSIDEAQQRQTKAYEAMEKEILVAGSDYEPILKPLYTFMQSSAILNASPTTQHNTILTYKVKLDETITQVRNIITELSKPTSHKEGS